MSQVEVANNSSMVQRVAEIIGGGDVLPHHRAKARRIIEAMRVPTDLMEMAGSQFFEEGSTANNARASGIVFSAMMDAAFADS